MRVSCSKASRSSGGAQRRDARTCAGSDRATPALLSRWYDRDVLTPRSRRLLLLGAPAALVAGLWVLTASILEPAIPEGASSSVERASQPLDQNESLAPLRERTPVGADSQFTAADEQRVERNPGGALEGAVIDLASQPLAGAHVALESTSGERIERTSDSEGRFSIDELSAEQEWSVRAELGPAWKFCHATGVHLSPDGSWQQLVVVLTSWGTLDVALEDGLGAPITEGVSVDVSLAAEERASRPSSPTTPFSWATGQALASTMDESVDESGVAHFPWVWADRRLRIAIATREGSRGGERHVQGLLVLEKGELAGEVIRVPAGGRLGLRAEPFELRRSLAGKVSFPDGRPVPAPAIFVRANDRPADKQYRAGARGEQDGTFSIGLDGLVEGEVLRVRATNGEAGDQHTGDHAGGLELEVSGTDLRAEIVLQPMLAVAGRITRGGQPPDPGTLKVLPEPPASPAAPDDIGYQPVTPAGNFEVRSLAQGLYELEFTERGFLADARFVLAGVPAGSTNIHWELPEGSRARLVIAIHATQPVARFGLAVAQPVKRETGADWPTAPKAWTETTSGWFLRSNWNDQSQRQGSCTFASTSFQWRYHRFDLAGDPARCDLDLPEGVYALAVIAWDAQGRPFAPLCAQPARFTSGDYEILFDLAPTASVAGRVEGASPALGLELIALDAKGSRLPVFDAGGQTRERIALTAEGRFTATGLPAGTVVLRVATPADLERGLFGAEQKLELAAGETADVTLRW